MSAERKEPQYNAGVPALVAFAAVYTVLGKSHSWILEEMRASGMADCTWTQLEHDVLLSPNAEYEECIRQYRRDVNAMALSKAMGAWMRDQELAQETIDRLGVMLADSNDPQEQRSILSQLNRTASDASKNGMRLMEAVSRAKALGDGDDTKDVTPTTIVVNAIAQRSNGGGKGNGNGNGNGHK